MPRAVEIAVREAVGKRGVSVIVIPGDVALQQAVDAPIPQSGSLLPPLPSSHRAPPICRFWRIS